MLIILKIKNKWGFTLVEMMVSLTLFTIVSTVAVGALLSIIGSNQKLVKQQTLISSAIASLDNMTREIRTGNYYNCQGAGYFNNNNQNSLAKNTNNCSTGATGLSVVDTRSSTGNRIGYYFANDSLWRKKGNQTAEKLLPNDVLLDVSASRIYVTGAETLTAGSNVEQPTVTIVMVLKATEETEPLTLQTTITQRSLDI